MSNDKQNLDSFIQHVFDDQPAPSYEGMVEHQKTNLQCPPFVGLPNLFSPEECKRIIETANGTGYEDGAIGKSVIDHEVRSAKVATILPTEENQFIIDRIHHASTDINFNFYRFGIFDIEPIQICRYDGDSGDHYRWHSDSTLVHREVREQRKLSLSVLLNPSSDFEGGDLEVSGDNSDYLSDSPDFMKNPGDAVFFPSFMRHRVTPVTSGVRYTLVTWLLGPRWI